MIKDHLKTHQTQRNLGAERGKVLLGAENCPPPAGHRRYHTGVSNTANANEAPAGAVGRHSSAVGNSRIRFHLSRIQIFPGAEDRTGHQRPLRASATRDAAPRRRSRPMSPSGALTDDAAVPERRTSGRTSSDHHPEPGTAEQPGRWRRVTKPVVVAVSRYPGRRLTH